MEGIYKVSSCIICRHVIDMSGNFKWYADINKRSRWQPYSTNKCSVINKLERVNLKSQILEHEAILLAIRQQFHVLDLKKYPKIEQYWYNINQRFSTGGPWAKFGKPAILDWPFVNFEIRRNTKGSDDRAMVFIWPSDITFELLLPIMDHNTKLVEKFWYKCSSIGQYWNILVSGTVSIPFPTTDYDKIFNKLAYQIACLSMQHSRLHKKKINKWPTHITWNNNTMYTAFLPGTAAFSEAPDRSTVAYSPFIVPLPCGAAVIAAPWGEAAPKPVGKGAASNKSIAGGWPDGAYTPQTHTCRQTGKEGSEKKTRMWWGRKHAGTMIHF